MRIEVLGPGCARCQTLAENARAAAREIGLECDIVKVTDLEEIVRRGVIMTPALVIDGVVRTVGRAPSVAEIRSILSETKN